MAFMFGGVCWLLGVLDCEMLDEIFVDWSALLIRAEMKGRLTGGGEDGGGGGGEDGGDNS